MKNFNINKIFGNLLICFLIIFFVWFRYLRTRALGPLNMTYSTFKCYSYIFCIFISMSILIFIILRALLLTFDIKPNSNTWFNRQKQKILTIIVLKAVKSENKWLIYLNCFYIKIKTNIKTRLNDLFENLMLPRFSNIWLQFIHHICIISVKPYWPKVLIGLLYLPTFLMSFTFFIEVIYFNYLTFYVYLIPFTCIPLILRVLLYFFEETCEKIDQVYKEMIIWEKVEGKLRYTWAPLCSLPESERTLELLQIYINGYLENNAKKAALANWDNFFKNNIYRVFFVSFTCILSIMSFSYMLYKILI